MKTEDRIREIANISALSSANKQVLMECAEEVEQLRVQLRMNNTVINLEDERATRDLGIDPVEIRRLRADVDRMKDTVEILRQHHVSKLYLEDALMQYQRK